MPFSAAFHLPPHATLALACSGGADSVYLAHALHEFLNLQNNRLHPSSFILHPFLLHANHQLRGAESDGDEDFVKNLAQELGWPLFTERLPVPANPSEANLRQLRHDFFRRALAHSPKPVVLLFGHHLDDAAESVLMRLVRGSSSAGLAAPRTCHEVAPGWFHVRPLLALRRADIRQTLASHKLTWRDDSSNALPDPLRNKLRLEILPALATAAGRDPAPGLARARARADEDDTALNLWLDQLLPNLKQKAENKEQKSHASDPKPVSTASDSSLIASVFHPSSFIPHPLNFSALIGLPTALWRRALERALASFDPPICLNARAKESLLSHLQAGTSTTVSAGHLNFLQVSDHTLTLTRSSASSASELGPWSLELGASASAALPSGWKLLLESVPWPDPSTQPTASPLRHSSFVTRHSPPAGLLTLPTIVFLNPELAQPLQVRTWQPGDRFRPYRHPGTPKLQDLFVNRHIPRNLRHHLPVVTLADGPIVAVAGFPPGHEARVPENSSTALRLTFTPPPTT